jgi:hypothetical protein
MKRAKSIGSLWQVRSLANRYPLAPLVMTGRAFSIQRGNLTELFTFGVFTTMNTAYQPPTPHHWQFDHRAILPLRNQNFWKIERGVVRTSTWLEDGTLIVLGLWGPGSFVGKTFEKINPYQVECLTPVQAIPFVSVDQQQLSSILLGHLQQTQELTVIRSYKRTDTMLSKNVGVKTLGFTEGMKPRPI